MRKRLLMTALIALSLGFCIPTAAYGATPCKEGSQNHAVTTTTVKDAITPTTVKPIASTTATSVQHKPKSEVKPPCQHSTTTTIKTAPTTTVKPSTSTVPSVTGAVTSTSTSLPPDDSLTATDYGLPVDAPVELAAAQTVEQAPPAGQLAVTGAPLLPTIGAGVVFVLAGIWLVRLAARFRRDAIEGQEVEFK